MQEYLPQLVIGTLIVSGSSIIAIITFWMKIGARLATGETALQIANATVAKTEFLSREIADYKVEAAKEFVTSKDLAHAETRMTVAVESMRVEVRGMNERLDRFLETVMSRIS